MSKISEMVKRKTFWVGVIAMLAGVVDICFGDTNMGFTKILAAAGLITGAGETSTVMSDVKPFTSWNMPRGEQKN